MLVIEKVYGFRNRELESGAYALWHISGRSEKLYVSPGSGTTDSRRWT